MYLFAGDFLDCERRRCGGLLIKLSENIWECDSCPAMYFHAHVFDARYGYARLYAVTKSLGEQQLKVDLWIDEALGKSGEITE